MPLTEEQYKTERELKVEELEGRLPELNEAVCGAATGDCDELCGGAGCGSCGGPTCSLGSLTKSQEALEYAGEAARMLEEKQAAAYAAAEAVRERLVETESAKAAAQRAHDVASSAASQV